MNSYNAIGRLTRDPELVWLENGNCVCRMRVAIDRMGRDGQAGYINVASFGNAGKAAAEHLSTGSPVAITGRLEYHERKAKDGSARSGYTVIGSVGSSHGPTVPTPTSPSPPAPRR